MADIRRMTTDEFYGTGKKNTENVKVRRLSSDQFYSEQSNKHVLRPAPAPAPPAGGLGVGGSLLEMGKSNIREGARLAQTMAGAGAEMAGNALSQHPVDLAMDAASGLSAMTPLPLDDKAVGLVRENVLGPRLEAGTNHFLGARAASQKVFGPIVEAPILQEDPRIAGVEYLGDAPIGAKISKGMSDVGGALPSQAPTIAAGLAFGPTGARIVGGAIEGAANYEQNLKDGLTPEQAFRESAVVAGGVGILSGLPFDDAFKGIVPKKLQGKLASFIRSGVLESGSEAAEGGLDPFGQLASGRRKLESMEDIKRFVSDVATGVWEETSVIPATFVTGGIGGAMGEQRVRKIKTIPPELTKEAVRLAAEMEADTGDTASPVDRLEPGPNAPTPTPERFEEDYAPFDLPAQEQAPTAPSTPQQSEAIPEPTQAPDNAVAPSPEAVVAPEPEPELSESEKQAEADLLAEFPELKGMLDAARRSGPLNEDLVNAILSADTVDSREIPKVEVRKPVSKEESLSKLIEERPALDVGRPLDAAVRPEEEGVPQGPARVTVRAQGRPRPGEREPVTVPRPEVRASVRGPEPSESPQSPAQPSVGSPPKQGLAVANIGADGTLYIGEPGEIHYHLSEKYGNAIRDKMALPAGKETFSRKGFVGPDGKFMTREEALAWVQRDAKEKENKFRPQVDTELDAIDYREYESYNEARRNWDKASLKQEEEENAAAQPAAEFLDWQERPRGQAPIALYNIPTPDGGKTTVTAETAKSQGFSVPEPPSLPATQPQEPVQAQSPVRAKPVTANWKGEGEGGQTGDRYIDRMLINQIPTYPKDMISIEDIGNGLSLVSPTGKGLGEFYIAKNESIKPAFSGGGRISIDRPVAVLKTSRKGVEHIAVLPEFQRRGLSQILLGKAKDLGRDVSSAEMATEAGAAAINKFNASQEQPTPPVRATEIAPEPEVAPEAPTSTLSPEDEARIKHYVTSARGPRNLFGDRFSAIRQEILRILTGTKPPKSKAGVTAVAEALYKHTNTPNGSISSMEDFVLDWAAGKAKEQPAKQPTKAKAKAKKGGELERAIRESEERVQNGIVISELREALAAEPKEAARKSQIATWRSQFTSNPSEVTASGDIVGSDWEKASTTKVPTKRLYEMIDSAIEAGALWSDAKPDTRNRLSEYGKKKLSELRGEPAPEAKREAPKAAAGGDAVAKALQRELDRRTEENISLKQKIKDVKSGKIGPYSVLSAPKATKAGAVRELERRISVNNEPIDKYEERRVVDLDIESSMDLGEDIDAGLLDYFSNVDSPASTGPRGEKSPRADSPRKQRVDMLLRRGYSLVGDAYTKALPPAVQQADARLPKPKGKKGKSEESGYVNMALFNPMEALRILRGKLKDGKFIEFEQGFMGLKDLKVARSGKIKSLQMRGKLIAQDFENAWRKEWQKQNPGVKAKTVRFRDMPAETAEALNDYLVEEDAGVKAQLLSELPEGLRRPATQMRDLVDQMSQELIDMGIVEDDVQKVIADQMGFYLRRTYAIFQDPKYRDNIPKSVEDNARKWLREKFPTYTTNQIESALADLKGVGSEKEALNRLVQMGGVLGKLDRRTLGKRNEYDQAILDLWGVDKNGIDNFLNTINAQAHMIANFEWLEDIKANGRGSVVLTPQDIAALPQGDEKAQWPFLNESDSRKSVSMSTRPKDPAASRSKALDKFIAKAESQGDAGTVEVLKKTKALFEKGMKLEDGKEVVDSRNLEGASKYAERLQAEADKFQAEGVAAPRGKKGPLKAKSRVAQSKANKVNRQIKAILEAEEQKANAEPDTFGPFGPLAGARVHPEFKAALQEAVQIQELWGPLQKLNWLNSQLKQNVTTRDPASALRNFRSGIDFSMANGWMIYKPKSVPKRLERALSIANVDIRRSHDPELREEYLKMVEYGIAGDTAIVGELNEIQKEAKKWELAKKAEKLFTPEVIKALGGTDALATKLYQAGDDVFKIFGALTEQEHLMDATGMEADAALKEGAARVRRQFPTYSELHKILQKFRRTPFIGPFVAYQSEVPRNAWNTIAQMATELKSKNPKVRAMGYRRAAGIMWATTNRHMYKAAWLALLGLTPDDDDRIRKALPEYYQGHEFAITEGDKATGKYLGYNMSQADAYGPLKEAFWAAMRGDNIIDAAGDAVNAFGGGYVAPQLGTQAVVDLFTGKDARGNDIYLKTDDAGEAAVKVLLHASGYAAPSPARRQAKAETAEEHLREVFGTLTGYRFIDIDLPESLFWKAKDFKKYGTEQVRDAYTAARDGDTEAAKKQLKDLEAVRKDYFDELQEAYIAFRDTGLNQEIMDTKLKEAGLSGKEIEAVKYGTLEPYTPPQKLTDMME